MTPPRRRKVLNIEDLIAAQDEINRYMNWRIDFTISWLGGKPVGGA